MGLGRIKRLSLPLFFLFIAGFLSACSRSVPEKVELKIGVPFENVSQSVGAMTSTEELEFVIINLRANSTSGSPSAPRVFHFESPTHFKDVKPGGTVELSISGNDIPVSTTTLVQYLGGFKNTATGALRFSYGDVVVNTNVNGVIAAPIQAGMFGASSGREVQFAGRYTNMSGGTSGPTGDLIAYFQPPLAGRPLMAIERRDMIDGWFSAFALEDGGSNSPKFTFKLIDRVTKNETTLWSEVNSASAMFTAADANSKVKRWVAQPYNSFYTTSAGFATEPRAGALLVAGYWADSPGNLPTSADMTVTSFDVQTLPYKTTGVGIENPFPYYGGTPGSHAAGLFIDGSDPGDVSLTIPSGNTHIAFNPKKIDHSDTEVFGFKGVFKAVNDNDHSSFLNASGSVSSINLAWNYLPLSNPVSGAVIFHKSYTGGYGNDDDDRGSFDLAQPKTCYEKLDKKGFKPYFTEVSGAGLTATVTATPLGLNFTQLNGNSFAVCPYRMVGVNRQYFADYARTDCVGGCINTQEQIFNFGNKVPGYAGHDIDISTSGTYNVGVSPVNGAAARIIGASYDTGLSEMTFEYNPSGASGFNSQVLAGDELLIIVNGATNTACGMGIGPGYSEFVKVKSKTTPYVTVKVPAMGALPSLASSAYLTGTQTSANFCYVQMVRVVHAGDFTIAADATLAVYPFSWGLDGGGVIAMRVNGTLSFASDTAKIDSSGFGYAGGTSYAAGDSMGGSAANSFASMGGGQAGTTGQSGGGGAGVAASGGNGESNAAVLSNMGIGPTRANLLTNYDFQPNLKFGAGGGAGQSGTGGAGGGIIFISARNISVAGVNGNSISSDGIDGMSISGGGGGGGGGTVALYSLNVKNGAGDSGQLKLSAKGGAGGAAATSTSGGGGGGGYILTRVCGISPQKDFEGIIPGRSNITPTVVSVPAVQGGLSPDTNGNAYSLPGLDGLLDNRRQHPVCQGFGS